MYIYREREREREMWGVSQITVDVRWGAKLDGGLVRRGGCLDGG